MINFGFKKQAFSLMEMMVVMLVVSIILALSAPMITKKTVGAGQGHCLWTSLPGGNIGFNANQNAVSVVIGGNTSEVQAMGANTPKLTIATNSSYPHIGFLYDDKLTGTLLVGNNDTISLGNNSRAEGNSSIAIGANAQTAIVAGQYSWGYCRDAIAIGTNTTATDKGSIAIGNNAKTVSECCIAIGEHTNSGGYKSSLPSANSIALGRWANAYKSGSVAIGHVARALDEKCIAIGDNSNAAGFWSIAIGRNSLATQSACISIGDNSYADSEYSTSIGGGSNIGNNSEQAAAFGFASSIGNNSEHAISLGHAPVGNNCGNSIAIGGGVFDNSRNSIAILGTTEGNSSIAIGDGYVTDNSTCSIALKGTIQNSTNSIAIGSSARIYPRGKSTVAIGNDSCIYEGCTSSIALGDGTTIGGILAKGLSNAIAIGTDVTAAASNTIVIGHGITNSTPNVLQLGDKNTTVYIPGKIEFGNITANNVTVKNDLYAGGTVALNNLYYAPTKYGFYRLEKPGSASFTVRVDPYSWDTVDGIIDKNLVSAKNNSFNIIIDGQKTKLSSDKRLKNILGENYNAMDKIRLLKVYDYTFKKEDLRTPHVGVMAQDLQKIFPNAVTKDENGYLQIRHEDMFYAMINALKELDAKIKQIALQLAENIKIVTSDSGKIRDLTIRINNQDKEIKALKKEVAKIDDLKKEIADLKKRVNK